MNYVLIIHAVKDYRAWKEIFDGAATMRRNAGEQTYHVLRDAHDPNKIVHFSRWTSIEKAKAFFESPDLVDIRRRAGVEAPEFNYLLNLEEGVL